LQNTLYRRGFGKDGRRGCETYVEGGTSIAGFLVKKLTGLRDTFTISAGLHSSHVVKLRKGEKAGTKTTKGNGATEDKRLED
jgi:hypothetical protein